MSSNPNTRIAKNSIFMSIRMVIVLFINLYSSRVLLSALGVEDYGIYNVVAGFAAMFSFLNSSLSNGIQRFFNYELGRNGVAGANKVYISAIIIQVLLAITVIIPTEIFGTWYLHNKMIIPPDRMFAAEWIFQLALITFILHIMQVPFSAAIMAHERMNFYAFISVFNAVFTLIGILVLSYLHGDLLIIYGIIITLSALISLVCNICYAKVNFEEIFLKKEINKKLLKEMFSFSSWNLFGTLGHLLKDQGVNLILNFFFGPVVNAARGVAYQVNSGLQSFVSNITIPVRPQIVQSYSQGNFDRAYNLMLMVSKMSCYLLLMMAIPIILEIDYILQIWLGDNIPEKTSAFLIIIIINSFLSNLNSAISSVVHASGKMRKYQIAGGAVSLLSVILVYFAVSFNQVPEVAFWLICIMDLFRQIIAVSILKQIDNNRLSSSNYCKKVILPIILVAFASIIIPIILHNLMSHGLIRLCVVLLTSILSVGIFTYLLGLSNIEREFIKNAFQRIVSKVKQ